MQLYFDMFKCLLIGLEMGRQGRGLAGGHQGGGGGGIKLLITSLITGKFEGSL